LPAREKRPRCSRYVEAVSKPSIGFKVKAAAGFKPEEYIKYFEDLDRAPNAEIGPYGRF